MHTLMEYRHKSIHSELLKIRDKYSMLHLDALILVYHFAKISDGAILEIGAFVGGDHNDVALDQFTVQLPPSGGTP